MTMSPAVSIVVPAYNAAAYIRSTLDSVIAQTFSDYEVIVVNDCSTDDTAEIVGEYCAKDSRFRLIGLDKNRGAPAGPRNIGVAQARGRWIALLDSDDIWHPRKLERQIDLLSRTGARFCSTQMVDFVNEADLELSDAAPEQFEWVTFFSQLLKFRTPTSSVVVDRELLLKHPFDERMSFKAREDLDCWLHCHEELGQSVKITAPMMGYRIIPGQISGKKWAMFKRHLHVLSEYRFKSGRALGIGAYVFTLSHFAMAFYLRGFRKRL